MMSLPRYLDPVLLTTVLLATVLAATFAAPTPVCGAPSRRNVVLIMTDNHGAWTLGCYGNPDIRTPHIDRLASEGVRFTRAFSCNAVCSPTRATYLTGLLPSQHGVHCFLRAREAQIGPDAYCTIDEFRTLPEILANAGYDCGLVGKWHLGKNLEPHKGFTSWITMPHGATSTFYDAEVIENGKIRREPTYLTDLWTERAVQFIATDRSQPFFLFLSFNGPYGLGGSLARPARNRHAAFYADQLLSSFPREQMHPWQFNNKQYLNNIEAMRRYAAELSAVDDGVGAVLAELQRQGLDQNTVVIFTADQGWSGGQHGLWGMGDHTRPLHAFDGTMHIPLIFRQPGVIPAGVEADELTSNYDFLPTLLSHLDLDDEQSPTPASPGSPGRNYAPLLRGRTLADWDNTVFYDFENVRAIRTGDWKYVERFPDGPHELYDLSTDPGEQFNLYGQPQQSERQAGLRGRLTTFFSRYADPDYDLWHGGGSKTALLSR